jgi:hypothetical protein
MDIHWPSKWPRNKHVTIGPECASCGTVCESSSLLTSEEFQVARPTRAPLTLHIEHGRHRPPGPDINYPRHRRVAIERRSSAFVNLHLGDLNLWDHGPVHPTSHRVIEWHSVKQYQGSADAAGSEPPQRRSLRCWLRYQTARAPEQAERRHLLQEIIQRQC